MTDTAQAAVRQHRGADHRPLALPARICSRVRDSGAGQHLEGSRFVAGAQRRNRGPAVVDPASEAPLLVGLVENSLQVEDGSVLPRGGWRLGRGGREDESGRDHGEGDPPPDSRRHRRPSRAADGSGWPPSDHHPAGDRSRRDSSSRPGSRPACADRDLALARGACWPARGPRSPSRSVPRTPHPRSPGKPPGVQRARRSPRPGYRHRPRVRRFGPAAAPRWRHPGNSSDRPIPRRRARRSTRNTDPRPRAGERRANK